MDATQHKPVMLAEAIDALNLKTGDTVVDATLGGGGYAKEILKKIGPTGKLIAIDADADAIERFRKNNPDIAANVTLVHSNYSDLSEILKRQGIEHVDAVVADLGFSSDQLEDAGRGFSFQKDEPLSMLYDASSEQESAEMIVNTWRQDDLVKILKEFSEEKHAKKIAAAIVTARKEKPLTTTKDLVSVIESAVPERYKHQKIPRKTLGRSRGKHPATRTFQALRIAANQEYSHLQSFLDQAIGLIRPGGRIGVVTFHSGEDRVVKNVFRENARGCICPAVLPVCRCNHKRRVTVLAPAGVRPTHEEVLKNPRARSARLRVCERIDV